MGGQPTKLIHTVDYDKLRTVKVVLLSSQKEDGYSRRDVLLMEQEYSAILLQ